ncbi:hypothetical protein EV700_2619 [Fluviicoccus keumensis]|uniref:Uncharacterized protein n=1 Tax=Fluviicoccus keumensis TaxID=1435465 RepID=A0A4Q7YNU7_9GAMM|nr:hypothetical protein [Fluviicoccus keumensis]RZU38684.1 hypothetical protein EV700_2619 [Fluviicoccus keumensis]
MTIARIRLLQNLCRFCLITAMLMLPGFLVENLCLSNGMVMILIAALAAGAVLTVVIRRLRCPVCSHIFVGREHVVLFTVTCCNCGRRAGDTA